jgi:hypothetical protein
VRQCLSPRRFLILLMAAGITCVMSEEMYSISFEATQNFWGLWLPTRQSTRTRVSVAIMTGMYLLPK